MKHPRGRSAAGLVAHPRVGHDESELLAEIKVLLVEVRVMLIAMRHSQGDDRAGARSGPMIFRDEKLIPLEDAVALVWSVATARTKESRDNHAKILKLFGTMGLNGTVLETAIRRKRWHTSREAVDRFVTKAFGQPGARTNDKPRPRRKLD